MLKPMVRILEKRFGNKEYGDIVPLWTFLIPHDVLRQLSIGLQFFAGYKDIFVMIEYIGYMEVI